MRIEINNCNSQSVSEWINSYREEPVIALEKLLFKGVYMGNINILNNEDIISKLFQNVSPALLTELDNNMLKLIKKLWGTFPKENIKNLEKWSADWVSVFRIVGQLRLTITVVWLMNIMSSRKERRKANKWFEKLYKAPCRDPLAEMRSALNLYSKPIPKD